MDTDSSDLTIADVVRSVAGRDEGHLFYVLETDGQYLILADGKHRMIEKPKRKKIKHTVKVLRSETRVAEKLRLGEKVLNSELRKDLAYLSRDMQSNNLGG